MSTIDDTIDDVRGRTSPQARSISGIARRMEIRLTAGPLWQVVGHLLMDNRTLETRQAEPFTGIGFYSRPAPGANVDAIVLNIAGAQNPMIVATRDEGLRRAIENERGEFAEDESAMFNTAVVACCASTGKFMVSTPGGTPHEIAFASEVNNLRAFTMQQFSGPGHVHAIPGPAVTTSTVPVVVPVAAPASAYPGTAVLKAE